jgi:hypothetical protein
MGINRVDRGSDFGQPADAGGRSPQHPGHGPGRIDDGSEVSDLANLMNRLQQLLLDDAARFERVMTAIADRLRVEAGTETSPRAHVLGQLSDQFGLAGRRGALPTLQPAGSAAAQSPPHHGIQGYEKHPSGSGEERSRPPEELARIIQETLASSG